jgi:hypothetical protein
MAELELNLLHVLAVADAGIAYQWAGGRYALRVEERGAPR